MSAVAPSALGDGCFLVKPLDSQLQHCRLRHSHAPPATVSLFFGEELSRGGFLKHHHYRFLRVPASFSYHRPRHVLHSRNAATPSPPSSFRTYFWNGSPLQREQQQLQPFSYLTDSGGLSQSRLHRLHAHSQQHLSLKEDQQRLLRLQERREALQKYKTTVLNLITQQQASLQQSALLSTNLQTEGVTGYAPLGFDVSCCRIVFVGNVHKKVSKTFLAEVFSIVGPIAACRLIKKDKSSYGFVEYQNQLAAATAISLLNGRKLFKLPILVNWAFSSDEVEDLTEHHKIFVGNLSAHVTEPVLFKLFSKYPSRSIVRVVWDTDRQRPKGYGFVSFREKEDAIKAIEEMSGKMVGDKAIHCAWAVVKETTIEGSDGQNEDKVFESIKEDPRYTTVFVGNVGHEVSEEMLRQVFTELGVGVIEDVKIVRKRGHGFVKFGDHEEAAMAIQAADGVIIGDKPLKCWWGTKPNNQSAPSDPHSLTSKAEESSEALALLPVVHLSLQER